MGDRTSSAMDQLRAMVRDIEAESADQLYWKTADGFQLPSAVMKEAP